MKNDLNAGEQPPKTNVKYSDVELVRRGYESVMRKRGLWIETPMAKARRIRMERKGKL